MRIWLILLLATQHLLAQPAAKPLRVGVVGLVHDHVNWILGRAPAGDIEITGMVEPNRELAARYATRYGFSTDLIYASLEEMIEKTKPEAVLAFNSILDHLKVVEFCAPRGIHVMVEKPLAVSVAHATKMVDLAAKHHIFLLTNYETTWYGSNLEAWRLVNDEHQIGDIRKIVFHTGHQGPKEIGCSKEFLQWLTDPMQNGGGALTDFGCYGANIATWLMKGETPLSVTAVTQQIKPDVYPKVDDEATIVLRYPQSQVIIEASWNWPMSRKDMEVYGQSGYVFCRDKENMEVMTKGQQKSDPKKAAFMPENQRDPFAFFANVVRGTIVMDKNDRSGPANNLTVVRILEVARTSAKDGKTIPWNTSYKDGK